MRNMPFQFKIHVSLLNSHLPIKQELVTIQLLIDLFIYLYFLKQQPNNQLHQKLSATFSYMVALRRLVALWSYGYGVKNEERNSTSLKKESHKRKEPDSSTAKRKKEKRNRASFTPTFFLSDLLLLLEESTMWSKSIPMKGTIFSNRNRVITNQ